MNHNAVSIITSLYKSDRYLIQFKDRLKDFAKNLLAAKVDFEIIIIANEPSATEKGLADDFGGLPWFSFVEVPRETLYASWNRGVSLAKGQIIGFWNVDDARYYEAIVEARDLFSRGNELVYFPFKIKRYLNIGIWSLPLPARRIDREIPQYSQGGRGEFYRSMFCGPFFLFTKLLYEKVGPFDEQFKIAGDFDWCARAAKLSSRLVKAKTFGGEFRVDGVGLSAGGKMRQVAENNLVYKRNNVKDKIQAEDGGLAAEYRANEILFRNNWLKI